MKGSGVRVPASALGKPGKSRAFGLSVFAPGFDAQILPAFGGMALEEVTSEHVEHWLSGMGRKASTRSKALICRWVGATVIRRLGRRLRSNTADQLLLWHQDRDVLE